MSNHNPLFTTAQNRAAVLDRDSSQRQGQSQSDLIRSELVHNGTPGSGTCKWGARFTYSDGRVETSWGL